MEDSPIDIMGWLMSKIGERIGRISNTKYTTGVAANCPQGIVPVAPVAFQTASPTAIAADEVLDLIHDIDISYRRDPSFRLMLHDKILLALKKLKDGEGRYLFRVATDGDPATLHGERYQVNNDMTDTIAANNKTILAGAFNRFVIRQVRDVTVRQLNEIKGLRRQIVFAGFTRNDSKLVDAGTNPIKVMQQAP